MEDSLAGTTALKYMSVPESIQLAGGSRYQPGPEGRESSGGAVYRPMKVPDMITLASENSAPLARSEGATGGQQQQQQHSGGMPVLGRSSEVLAEPHPPAEAFPSDSSPDHHQQQQQQFDAAAMQSAEQAELLDLHRRVSNLEQQVQRLTETVVRRDSSSASAARGNSFWYALTFAGWVMVPLVVVYMFHYRKGI